MSEAVDRPGTVHPTAIVHPGAVIAKGAEIGPFCIVGENVCVQLPVNT